MMDFNGDNFVDEDDLTYWFSQLGKDLGRSAGVAAVVGVGQRVRARDLERKPRHKLNRLSIITHSPWPAPFG